MTDSPNSYVINADIYADKNSERNNLIQKHIQNLHKLKEPILNTNSNATADNWLTSIRLVELLKRKKSYLLSFLFIKYKIIKYKNMFNLQNT